MHAVLKDRRTEHAGEFRAMKLALVAPYGGASLLNNIGLLLPVADSQQNWRMHYAWKKVFC